MFCGCVVWAGMPIPPTFYLFTFLLLNVLWLRGMGKMPIPPTFYSFTFLLLSVAVGEWCHAGVLLEEVGHGTLVAEVEMVGYLAHRHIGLRE